MRVPRPAAFVLACALAGAAHAAEFNASVGGGLEYTSNAALTSRDEIEELIGTALLGLSVAEARGALQGRANASLLYRDYQNDTFGRQREFRFDGEGRWQIQPDRLTWVFTNDFSHEPIDTLAADTPDNRQEVNVFSTWIDAYQPLAARQRLSLTPRYDRFYYEKTDYDNQQYALNAAWIYNITSPLALSLNSNINRTEYSENDAYVDATMVSYYLALDGRTRRSNFTAKLGYTDILGDRFEDEGGVMASFSLTHQMNRRSALTFYAGSEVTNPSRVLAQVGTDPDLGIVSDQQVGSGVLRSDTLRLDYDWRGSRTSWNANLYWDDRDYGGTAARQRTNGVQIGASRPLGAELTGSLTGGYEHAREAETEFWSESWLARGSLEYAIATHIKATLALTDTRRTSNFPGAPYEDLRVLLFFSYGTGGAPQAAPVAAPVPGTSFSH